MSNMFKVSREQREHAHRVISEEAAKYGLAAKQMLELPKIRNLNDRKWHLWARLIWEVGLSVTWAGRFAKRDHTTLIHGMRRMGQEYYGLPYRSSLEEIGAVWRAHNLAWREAA